MSNYRSAVDALRDEAVRIAHRRGDSLLVGKIYHECCAGAADRSRAVELPAYADSYFEQLRAERDLDRFAAERWSL